MVSRRCIMIVKDALEQLGIQYTDLILGEVELRENISVAQLEQIRSTLSLTGLDLQEDKKTVLVHQIKALILELIYHSEEPLINNLSAYLSRELHQDYTYMANLFSTQ